MSHIPDRYLTRSGHIFAVGTGMRTIIIGDIHGCVDELRELIEKLSPSGDDDVISTGDLITKGPDPIGVLDFWGAHGWSAVIGNNEQRVLDLLDGGDETKDDVIETAERLSARNDLVETIRSLPVLIYRKDRNVAVVHGGVFPTTDLENPSAWRREDLLRMREIRKIDDRWVRIPSDDTRKADPFWTDVWPGPATVVYGHTPGYEIRRSEHAWGIDTGCVYGGELTAAILESGRWSFASVKARRAWAN